MRRTVVAVVLLGLAVVGYLAWPIHTLGALARAVEARDAATALSYVDLPRVRSSLSDQVIDTYLQLTGKVRSPLLRGAIAQSAGSIIDPILGNMFSPDALVELLRTGYPASATTGPPPAGVSGLTPASLGTAWQIYSSARYGIRRFEIGLPHSQPRDRRIELEFRIINWRWRLVDVRLPQHLRVQLAEMVIKAQKESAQR
jgi:hypothetical protein